MAKNVKSAKGAVDSPVSFPKKYTFDELAIIEDETLLSMQRGMVDSINRVNSHNLNPAAWETELCYIQREVQIRSQRREAHAKYLSGVVSVEAD